MKEKILLRNIRKSDKKHFFKWWRDKELIKLTSGNLKKIGMEKLTKYFNNLLSNNNNFVICVGDEVIGSIYFQRVDKDIFRFPIVIGEKRYRGRGYGSAAIRAILYLGFVVYGFKRAYLEVRPENKHAIKTYIALGFRKIGIKKYPRNKNFPVGLEMELSKTRWNKLK